MSISRRKLCLLAMVCLGASAWAQSERPYQWVFPWLANQEGRWASQVTVINQAPRDAAVQLTAVRESGQSQTVEIEIAADSAKVYDAGALFGELGSGFGYTVFMSSDEPNLAGRYLIFSKFAETANSPAAGEALTVSKASSKFSAAFMSSRPDQFSAVVLVNAGGDTVTADVSATLVAVEGAKRTHKRRVALEVEPGQPGVVVANSLFADVAGELNLTVEADGPLVANAFFFNAAGEPAIASVMDLTGVGPKIAALTDDDFHDGATPAKVALGSALFWDKILSGNLNISCATCHHTLAGTGDGLSLSIGQGGAGLGVVRDADEDQGFIIERVPRNAPPIFNSGAKGFSFMFHDGRVTADASQPSGFISPAEDELPSGLDNPLAAQAMFPVTSNTEMLGHAGQNEVADAATKTELWALLTARLMSIPEYQDLFRAAYPDIAVPEDVTFVHSANAMAAYENASFRADNSPFDNYLRGDHDALTPQQKRGMSLFYGKADCSGCHAGPLQTDMQFYAIGVPPIGPGKGDGVQGHDDFGRFRETDLAADLYRFRTPTLRNIALTAPYGHNGAFASLESVVRHHLDPETSLRAYNRDEALLPSRADLDATDFIALDDAATIDAIAAAIEIEPVELNQAEIADLIAFLHALTDPASLDMRRDTPLTVPSGLPVGD